MRQVRRHTDTALLINKRWVDPTRVHTGSSFTHRDGDLFYLEYRRDLIITLYTAPRLVGGSCWPVAGQSRDIGIPDRTVDDIKYWR